MASTRTENDSMGAIEVPIAALWGAQTGRSLRFFAIGEQRMPLAVIHALAWVKWAAAGVNHDLGLLDESKARAIAQAALGVVRGELDAEFPLSVWQTGSGTQSNMNVNEVLASLANLTLRNQWAGEALAPRVHPNDDVNQGQSSNDVFPTALHLAVALEARSGLLPALGELQAALAKKVQAFGDVVKVGRTHLQDATPITLGQEFSGYAAQLAQCHISILHALQGIHSLALGGTAVGTGLNTHTDFAVGVVEKLARHFELPLRQADNLFAAMAGCESLVAFHASLRMVAIALTKIANDIRLMGSGPRAGFNELWLPENEPGSSIMPGKVNPTQVEALTMVCAQVMGHDAAIGFAASQGQFELNVYRPLMALNALDSLRLLTDAMRSFARHCVAGLRANTPHIENMLERSLMLVTALTPHIGYDRAAQIAKLAHREGTSLRASALTLGFVTEAQFDEWVDARKMLGPTRGSD